MLRFLALPTILFALVACGDQAAERVVTPSPNPGVAFSLSTEPHELGGIFVSGALQNTGNVPVTVSSGVCIGDLHLAFTFLDPQGEPIQLPERGDPRPLCPSGRFAVNPGETVFGGIWFEGLIWNGTESTPAPPGVYTVTAELAYWIDTGTVPLHDTRQIQFSWDAAGRNP